MLKSSSHILQIPSRAIAALVTTLAIELFRPSLKDCAFPLPPLAEQSRIVARVASLRALCADLRQRLSARQSTQARLAEALVQDVA